MISAIVTWPLMFIAHGSPMNAIEDNVYSQKWKELGKTMPRPKSILAISAHWETDGIHVTGNVKQKTIHDFGGFPKALFDTQYTPPGSDELCKRVQELIPETKVDNSWGLDHGSWSILKVMYPQQDIPVIQLSLSQRLSPKQHFEIAKKLAPLRKEGVLIIGSGNIVHNLRELDWDNEQSGHKWAVEFNNYIKNAILAKDHEKLINYKQNTGAKLSVPTVEHYLPLLYIIGLQEEKDQLLLIGFLCGVVLFYKGAEFLTVPTYSQTVYTTLKNDVKIFRDEYGIPHIHANSRKDAIFGLGFVLAQDRLWQLHMRRLAAKNQLHKVLGEAALNFDQFIATVDYMDSCQRIVNHIDDDTRELLQSYADGINQGRKSLTILPIEFQMVNADFPDWEIIDTVAFIKLQSLILSNDYHIEMMRSTMLEQFGLEITNLITGIGGRNLYNSEQSAISKEEFKKSSLYQSSEQQQQYEQQNRPEGKDLLHESEILEEILPEIGGSNAWVIHGNYTTTGFPILASDPHLDNAMPSQWYQVEINYKTDFIIGGCMVGTPLILSGRSKHHAWGITILYSDTSDLYEEQLKQIDGKMHYLFKNEWLPTIEKIALNMTIHRTHHGPILNLYFDDRGSKQFMKPQKYYSLQSLVDQDDTENLSAFFKMIDEPILEDGLKHLKKVIYPSLAMVFASNQDIAYMPLGKLVLRDSHPDSHGYVKNGWDGLWEWKGLLSEEEHPIFLNPEKGYFSTANNRFFPEEDKYHFSWNVNPTARALQIDRILSQQIKKKISIEQTKQLQLDETDSYVFDTLSQLLQLLDTTDKQQQQFNETLYNWNCVFNEQSTQATLYSLFEHYYLKNFIYLPQRFYKIYVFDTFHFKNLLQFNDISPWCKKQSCLKNLRDAIQQAMLHYNSLSDKRFSGIKTQFYPHQPMNGKLFGFFDREIKHGGNRRTIRVSGFDSSQLPFRGNTGSNYRMIISMRPGDISQYILDTGISGNVLSKHYDDQMELWRIGDYIPMQIKYQTNELTLLKSNKSNKIKNDL